MTYDEYYRHYMGLSQMHTQDDGSEALDNPIEDHRIPQHVFYSKYREEPLNKHYYYPIILTDYFGDWRCSCDRENIQKITEVFELLKSQKLDSSSDIQVLIGALDEKLMDTYKRRSFYRYQYCLDKKVIEDKVQIAIDYREGTLQQQDGSCKSNRFDEYDGVSEYGEVLCQTKLMVYNLDLPDEFDRQKYIENNRELLEEGRIFVVLDGLKVAGRGMISDIYSEGCNIVVYVYEQYRQKGIGAALVRACVDWCLERNLLPIYFVDQANGASIALAQSLGFTRMNQEIIYSK